jgi:Na+/proline symporter
MPGEVLNHGPVVSLMGLLAIPFYYVIVGYVLAPRFMQHRVTSAYELLERQLGEILACQESIQPRSSHQRGLTP